MNEKKLSTVSESMPDLPIHYVSMAQLPWVLPTFVTAFITAGPLMCAVVLACIAISALLYYPFFKIADNQVYEEEQTIAAGKAE